MARFCGDGGAPAALRLIMMLRVWRRRWVDDNILYWLVMRLVAFFCCFPFLQQPEKLRGERESVSCWSVYARDLENGTPN